MISKPTSILVGHCSTGTLTMFAVSSSVIPNSVTKFGVTWYSVSTDTTRASAKYWSAMACLHYLHALLTHLFPECTLFQILQSLSSYRVVGGGSSGVRYWCGCGGHSYCAHGRSYGCCEPQDDAWGMAWIAATVEWSFCAIGSMNIYIKLCASRSKSTHTSVSSSSTATGDWPQDNWYC